MINLRALPLRAQPPVFPFSIPFPVTGFQPSREPLKVLFTYTLACQPLLHPWRRGPEILCFCPSGTVPSGRPGAWTCRTSRSERIPEQICSPNASEGQRSGSVEVRAHRSWLHHMSAWSPSLPHWPILSSQKEKQQKLLGPRCANTELDITEEISQK